MFKLYIIYKLLKKEIKYSLVNDKRKAQTLRNSQLKDRKFITK
mgnify:CR=1 FL=1